MPYIRNGTVTQKPLYVTVLELIMSFFETLKLLYLVFLPFQLRLSSASQDFNAFLPWLDREIGVLCADVAGRSP